MTIKYQGEVYRDDRMFVFNLSYGSYTKSYGAFSAPIEEGNAWILTTYRNIVELPITRTDHFFSLEDALTYISKIEQETPLISLEGKSLEIPNKILEMDQINESERPWEFYNRWLVSNKLFGVINEDFPKKYKLNCSYSLDKKGYTFEKISSSVNIIVDGVEEDVPNSSGNYNDITWKGGLKNGPGTEYFGKPKGPVYIKCSFRDDELHGSYERFYESGQLRSKGQFIDGAQTGFWEWFDEDGKFVKKGTFVNGELIEE